MEYEGQSVTGRIVISDGRPAFRGGIAHVTLEDVSRADAESTVIAECSIDNIDHSETGTEIRFAMTIGAPHPIDETCMYSVRVWIDVDGSGKPGPNDLFTDQTYRVLTHGYGDQVDIKI